MYIYIYIYIYTTLHSSFIELDNLAKIVFSTFYCNFLNKTKSTYFVPNPLVSDLFLFVHLWIAIRGNGNSNKLTRRMGWNINLQHISFYVELFK